MLLKFCLVISKLSFPSYITSDDNIKITFLN